MGFDLGRHAPPGFPAAQEKKGFLLGLSGSFLYSTSFLFRFFAARRELYRLEIDRLVLVPGRMMPDFSELLFGVFLGFWILMAALVLLLVCHYLYHYRETKSIYLMRRLPRRWELHRRCITLPLSGILLCLLFMGLLFLLYYALYVNLTPPSALPSLSWQKIWR